jgi:hypothetical protein
MSFQSSESISGINTFGSNDISMPRYKGRTSAKDIEKAFPHIVEMIVPLGDFGKARRYVRVALG